MNYPVLIAVILGLLAADPAPVWSLENKQAAPSAAGNEVAGESDAPQEAQPLREKGLWQSIRETGRDIGNFFTGVGRDTRKSASEVPGELKKESRAVGKGFKDAGITIGQESKKGAKAVGKGFKELGKDIKDSTKEAFVGEPEDSAR